VKAKRGKHETSVPPAPSPPGRVISGSGYATVTYVETAGSPSRLPFGFRPTKQGDAIPAPQPETPTS
jgi:hypothetical protein